MSGMFIFWALWILIVLVTIIVLAFYVWKNGAEILAVNLQAIIGLMVGVLILGEVNRTLLEEDITFLNPIAVIFKLFLLLIPVFILTYIMYKDKQIFEFIEDKILLFLIKGYEGKDWRKKNVRR